MKEPMTNQDSKLIWGGRVAIAGAILFLSIVLALHFLQPEVSLSTNLISEHALHRFGSAMIVAFLGLAGSFVGLHVAVCQTGGTGILRAALLTSAIGFIASGVITLDMSVALHLASAIVAFGSSLLAMYLFPTDAGRASSVMTRPISWGLGAGVGMGVVLMRFSVGGGERISAVLLLCWLIVVGWRMSVINEERH
jgi:hypothetical protein